MKQNFKYLLFLPIIVIMLDQLTKFLVISFMQPNQSIQIIPKIFHLTYVSNTGTFFGLIQGANAFFIWFILIILGLLLFFYDQFDNRESLVFALIIGAAIGNLIDRIVHGHVIDFLDFRIWPVFNVADAVVSLCVIILIVYLFKKR
ncbi:signal peptidase II [Candidatus Woesearchaeota archaeon]|jgi:signal peptidase II|nr:signal peptidase II [Candidatus Woesearchaeota archaeon]MBT5272345.1 signal peptidase II [Candidatus Woesearchaeota archaeon]MBT6041313.1 signal peptidase II [Candidatus Woesearchaeota archaeon]MBT6336617.1 signal peptidase II [Candidatus Woesearchaeota archaeon]MBT7927507.1 signal peptidase II [Candidatus Woesearchaeota archaeon]